MFTAKLLQHCYRYHKLRKTFSKFYRRHYELISKYNVGLKTLLGEGLSEPEFYGDLVYKFKKLIVMIFLGLKTHLSEGLSEPEFYGDLVYKFKKLIVMIFLFSLEKS